MRAANRPYLLEISRRILLVGAAILILGLGIGIGSSLSVPGVSITRADGGSHSVCVNAYTGQMRYVQSLAQCTQSEQAISWSQQGISGYELLQGDLIPIASGETEIHRLSCPDGKRVLGGGGIASYVAEKDPAMPEPTMFWSFPFDEHAWHIAVNNDKLRRCAPTPYAPMRARNSSGEGACRTWFVVCRKPGRWE